MLCSFISLISSKLRDHLQSLRMALHALAEGYAGELNDKQMELVLSVRASAEQLDDLLSHLIMLAELESGKYQLSPERLRLVDVVRACVERHRPQAEDKHIKLINKVWSGMPHVMADRQSVRKILDILLSNAIHYADRDGEVTIEAWERKKFIFISVCCTVSTESLTSTIKESSGTGLELDLVKHLVEANGGRMFLENHLDQSIGFTFALPIATR
jgi:signal transduction histidine kinase